MNLHKVVFIFFKIVALTFLTNCGNPPMLDVSISNNDKIPKIIFHKKNINGLLSLRIWEASTEELLWHINLNYYNGQDLEYGEIPRNFVTFNGVKNSAEQIFPSDTKKPKSLSNSSRFTIRVDYQYDSLGSPSRSQKTFEILAQP